MLSLRLRCSLLKAVVEAIRELANDANFDCSSTGFSLQASEDSGTALAALLRSDGFDYYRCDRTLAMSFTDVSEVLGFSGPDDIVFIRADDGSDVVTFTFVRGDAMFSGLSDSCICSLRGPLTSRTVKICAKNIDSEQIPEAEYMAIVEMTSIEFSRVCRDLSCIGDAVTISVTAEGVKFGTSSWSIATANILFRQNDRLIMQPAEVRVIRMVEPVCLTFRLRYMDSFTKAMPLSNMVTIRLSDNLPIVVDYKIAEKGYVRFYLACT